MHVYLPTRQKNEQNRKGETDRHYRNQLTNTINNRYTITKFLKYTADISINVNRKIVSIAQLYANANSSFSLQSINQSINQSVIFIVA